MRRSKYHYRFVLNPVEAKHVQKRKTKHIDAIKTKLHKFFVRIQIKYNATIACSIPLHVKCLFGTELPISLRTHARVTFLFIFNISVGKGIRWLAISNFLFTYLNSITCFSFALPSSHFTFRFGV